jgi:hypothetical protein
MWPLTGGATSGCCPGIPDIIRTATNLVPPEVQDVRIIDIVGLDQQADGGSHVASPRQVGGIQVVKIENKGKGFPPGPHPGHRPRPRLTRVQSWSGSRGQAEAARIDHRLRGVSTPPAASASLVIS